jgi:hypothetical protein
MDFADLVSPEHDEPWSGTMKASPSGALRVVALALCAAGLTAIVGYGRAVARHDTVVRDAAKVEDILLRELEIEALRAGAQTGTPEARSILRARARYEAALFARALADGMEVLDPVIEARLLELLAADLGKARPTSAVLLARARELELLANDPVLRRRLINKRMLWEG